MDQILSDNAKWSAYNVYNVKNEYRNNTLSSHDAMHKPHETLH